MNRRHLVIALPLLAALLPASARDEVNLSIGVSLPGVQIGINVPAYPDLQPVPGYPVYYAPGMPSNYFFYDGAYWVFTNDVWYSSTWYNGPWVAVAPAVVPLFLLRVPVRYYRVPPPYFRGWRAEAPPPWGRHWGPQWEQQRRGWDHWDRHDVPRPAPLPTYQRDFSGNRYPAREQQQAIRAERYHYQAREVHDGPPPQAAHAPQAQPRPQPQPQPQPQPRPGTRPQPNMRPEGEMRPPAEARRPGQERGPDRAEQRRPNEGQPQPERRGPENRGRERENGREGRDNG